MENMLRPGCPSASLITPIAKLIAVYEWMVEKS